MKKNEIGPFLNVHLIPGSAMRNVHSYQISYWINLSYRSSWLLISSFMSSRREVTLELPSWNMTMIMMKIMKGIISIRISIQQRNYHDYHYWTSLWSMAANNSTTRTCNRALSVSYLFDCLRNLIFLPLYCALFVPAWAFYVIMYQYWACGWGNCHV